jgi:hypothetical protein
MRNVLANMRRRLPELMLAAALLCLWYAFDPTRITVNSSPDEVSLRNNDFPNTYIKLIHVDLSVPNCLVELVWNGRNAAQEKTGPFKSSPGAGWGSNDCNDPVESNCLDSRCTPKGARKVEGFGDCLKDHPESRYVTFIDIQRRIGFHSAATVPAYPASHGCVRLEPYAARLIHDNSIEGKTEILIDGTWSRAGGGEQGAGSKP